MQLTDTITSTRLIKLLQDNIDTVIHQAHVRGQQGPSQQSSSSSGLERNPTANMCTYVDPEMPDLEDIPDIEEDRDSPIHRV